MCCNKVSHIFHKMFFACLDPELVLWKTYIWNFAMSPGASSVKNQRDTQIAKFMGPTWGPPGSCRPQMGPMLAPWTLPSGDVTETSLTQTIPVINYPDSTHGKVNVENIILHSFDHSNVPHVTPYIQIQRDTAIFRYLILQFLFHAGKLRIITGFVSWRYIWSHILLRPTTCLY